MGITLALGGEDEGKGSSEPQAAREGMFTCQLAVINTYAFILKVASGPLDSGF